MARRRRNLPLWLRLLIRRLRSPEGKLAPLAVISIAVSVTLATGLEMASRSAQRHLDATAEAIRGSAEIEVTAGDVGLPEGILEVVRSTPGVRAASPLVSVKVRLVDHEFILNLVGVDLLAEEEVRTTEIERNGLHIRDPLRLLAIPNSVVATDALLDRLGLKGNYPENGQIELRVRANGSDETLVVQGVLSPVGIAAAFSGQVALMDVYAAQALGGRVGLFDRIDVVPELSQDVPQVMDALRSRLAGVATVQRSSAHSIMAEDLLAMVRKSSLLLASISALVACMLTYSTTAQWVERQKRQLATLRAVGMEGRRVRQLIVVEVGALAFIGTALGVVGGIAISPSLLSTLSAFLRVAKVEEFNGITVQLSTLWVAVGVGLIAGVAGSVLPARRAGSRFTLDALDVEVRPPARRDLGLWLAVASLIFFALLGIANREVVRLPPMIRLGVLFLLGSLAILSLAPTVLRFLRIACLPLEHASPSVGHLVTRFFRGRPWTFAVALTAISTLVGALVTVFLLIATIGSAVDRAIVSLYPAGAVLVSPDPFSSAFTSELLSPSTMDLIRATPGVTAVNERYRGSATVIFRGRVVPVNAESCDVVARRGQFTAVHRSSGELARDLSQGAIAVSTGFSKTFGLGAGDALELNTHSGPKTFSIAGVFEDFGDATGSILIDIQTFDASWKRAGASSAMIWVDGAAEPILDEIQRRVRGQQDLFFANTSEVAEIVRRQTEVFNSTLRVLGAFVSSLGGIGVMILLTGIVAERRRDFAVLCAAGAEPRQLLHVVQLDSLTLGLLGSLFGSALGLACAAPAADILRESFGWILDQCWTAPELPWIIVGTIGFSVISALIPARMAYRTRADEVFGPE